MEIVVTAAHLWVVIGLTAFSIGTLFYLVVFRKARLHTKALGIYVPEAWSKSRPDMQEALDCMYKELPVIRKIKRDLYTEKLKELGVPCEATTAHEDYAFYDQCLGNIIYSGNGIKSFKNVLEMEILHGTFLERRRDSELRSLVEVIVERLLTEADSYLDRAYRSSVTTDDGSQRLRRISRETLALLEEKSKPAMVEVVLRMFEAAVEHGCKME